MPARSGFGVMRHPELVRLSAAHFGPFDAPPFGARVGRVVVGGWLGGPGQSYPCHPLDDHPGDATGGQRHETLFPELPPMVDRCFRMGMYATEIVRVAR